ncbi:MAG: PaaI family thioesterase [Lachnospiraceae bacterium]|nr:PaaI family thioesterase [Lachnospiraceae bacterium]
MNYEEQITHVNETNPFMIHNQIRAVGLTGDRASVEAKITKNSLNAMQRIHGGLMFVMAEVAAGLVTRNDGRRYVTLDSSFRFISGCGQAGRLTAEASITKRGRTLCFTRARVWESESKKLLAEGEFTFYCLDGDRGIS